MGNGFVELAIVLCGEADIAVSFRIVGLELERLAVTGERLVASALVLEDIAQVEMGLGVIGLERNRSRDTTRCRFHVSNLMRELAEAVPRLDVIRIGAQDFAVRSLGSLQMTR